MRKYLNGSAAALFAAAVAITGLGLTSSTAEAGGLKKKKHGVTIIIGGGKLGPGYGYGCGWYHWKWTQTGHPKWYHLWHKCRYGW